MILDSQLGLDPAHEGTAELRVIDFVENVHKKSANN
jgi:hypothetical protein